jgi:ABC-type sugar transport system permease subunit
MTDPVDKLANNAQRLAASEGPRWIPRELLVGQVRVVLELPGWLDDVDALVLAIGDVQEPLLRVLREGNVPDCAVAKRPLVNATATRLIIVGNALWVAGSVLLLVSGWIAPNILGWAFIAAQALFVAVLASAWGGAAFNMLLFIAAISNVPRSYYEAAELDGANAWKRFWHITLPSIAPTSVLVILLSSLGAMKEFAMIQALNGGGPGTQNRLIVQYIYETGFQRSLVGYASAASMVLLVILMIIAIVQLRISKRKNAW